MSNNTLDMALDDVIKKGGSGGGKRGNRPEKKAGGGGRKAGQGQTRKAAAAASDAPKSKEPENKQGMLARISFVKGIAGAAIKMASKAAQSAAKGTATDKTKFITGRSEAAKAAAAASKDAPARTAGAGRRAGKPASIESTAAKLGMTLDDICKVEVKGKPRAGKGEKGKAAGDRKGGMRLKLRRDGNLKRKAGQPVARAKGKAKARAKGAARNVDDRKAGGRGGGGSSWYEPPSSWGKGGGKSGGKGGRGGDWGSWSGPSKRSWGGGDDWGMPPAKRGRSDWGPPARGGGGAGNFGWGRGGDDYGSGSRGSRPPMDFHDHRGGRDEAWSSWDAPRGRAPEPRGALAWDRPEPRDRERLARRDDAWERPAAPAARAARSGETCRIKVTNVPLDLDRHDIKEAFEDRGRVVRCEVDRGVATIVFEEPRDAKMAVQTFDRGELNGQTIFVSLD